MSHRRSPRCYAALALVMLILGASTALARDPYWGPFKDDGCRAANARQFSSVLWAIPPGQSWEDTCWRTPGFDRRVPDRCVNAGGQMWGEWDVADNSCPP